MKTLADVQLLREAAHALNFMLAGSGKGVLIKNEIAIVLEGLTEIVEVAEQRAAEERERATVRRQVDAVERIFLIARREMDSGNALRQIHDIAAGQLGEPCEHCGAKIYPMRTCGTQHDLDCPVGIAEEAVGYLRPEVVVFAEAMERRLRANDDKGGWDDLAPYDLLDRLSGEVAELVEALGPNQPVEAARREAADVANYAMMIADVLSEGGRTNPLAGAHEQRMAIDGVHDKLLMARSHLVSADSLVEGRGSRDVGHALGMVEAAIEQCAAVDKEADSNA